MTPGTLSPKHGRIPRHSKDHPPDANAPTILYRLYGADGSLLYIGITSNKRNRFKSHGSNSRWWKEVARKEFQTYPNRAAAVRAEERAVLDEKPKYNVEYLCPKVLHLTLSPAQREKLASIAVQADMGIRDMLLKMLDDYA